MNIYSNDAYFADQLQRAKRLRTYGLLAVVLSFLLSLFASYNIWLIYLSYPLLMVGLPLWTYGRSIQRKLTKSPRPDKEIDAELKGLSNKFALHHYATIGGQLVRHLLVSPNGLVVMESSEALGPIRCGAQDGADKWYNRVGMLDRLSGVKPPVGNPSRELTLAIDAAKGLLTQIGKPDVPAIGLVVFTRNPELEVDECGYAALPLEELKETVRGIQYELGGERGEGTTISRILTTEERRRISALIAPAATPVVTKPVPVVRRGAEKA